MSSTTNQLDDLIDLLRRSVRGLKQKMIQELKSYNITVPQAFVLRSLHADGPHNLIQLANNLDMSTSSLSGIIERLVRLNYVNRDRDEADRRTIIISLSKNGQKLIQQVPVLNNQYFHTILQQMNSNDIELLNAQLQKLVTILELEGKGSSL